MYSTQFEYLIQWRRRHSNIRGGQVWCARRRGPRTPSRTTDANLDSAFVKNAFVLNVLKVWGARAPMGPLG